MLRGHFHQLVLHLFRPHILAQRWIYYIAKTLSYLQLALNYHFLCDLRPPLLAIMFEKYDEHDSLTDCPSPSTHAGIDAIVELVVNFFKGAPLHVLADLLPIIAI